MTITLGSGSLTFEPVEAWEKLPEGWSYVECPGVAVDSQDNVYVLTRGEHPIIVFDRDGNFLRSFGEGLFSLPGAGAMGDESNRSHGLYVAHDDSILAADDSGHTIQKFSPRGELILKLGERNQPAPRWSGQPFNRPTSAAIMPSNGDIYVSDGYGNARIHVYSGTGDYKFSWGSPGIDPGQFCRPHNIAIDADDRVYVVDREAHRIQIFDAKGNFITMWNNIYRPDAMVLWEDHIYVGEFNGLPGVDDAPGMGHRVSIYNMKGERVCLFGDPVEGEGPGQFIAPHGIAVDSRGDLYVSEVSYSVRGARMDPPTHPKSLKKFVRKW